MMLGFEHDKIDYPEPTPRKGAAVAARSIKDPIHDLIPISPRLAMFIDTKQFQRLRNIKQLGTSYYVWAGASHNRFEHCIGVAFLARAMATHLKDKQPELGITERDIECVEIAGLCHDLGHGPWSHVWDGLFIPKALPGSKWVHEDGSVMMFDAMVKETEIPLNDKDDAFIKALISGNSKLCSPDEKPFLFDIVANKRNGLDVDKFDYIPRDSHMVGDKMSIALPRIINSAKVLDNQICYDIKDANQIYDICATRFKLHKIVYNHKAGGSSKAIEYMIIDALLAAEPYMHIAHRVHDAEKYLHLTDNIMLNIEASTEPELAPARAIFGRIRTRDLYKLVDYKVFDFPYADVFKESITPANIVEAARALNPTDDEDGTKTRALANNLKEEDIICDFSLMHYGMKEDNPLDFVRFYSKRQPNRGAKAERGVYSNLMPTYHAEHLVRIFTKNVDYFGIIQAGYRACLARIRQEAELDQIAVTDDILEPELLPLFPVTTPIGAPSTTSTSTLSSGTFRSSSSTVISAATHSTHTPPAPDAGPPLGIGPAPTTSHGSGTGRTFSRASSFTFGAGGGSADPALFSDNAFTTVGPDFVPGSPSRKGKGKRRSIAENGNKNGSAGGETIAGRPESTSTISIMGTRSGRPFSRATSLNFGFGSPSGSADPSVFSDNEFTTVCKHDHTPGSPSRPGKRRREIREGAAETIVEASGGLVTAQAGSGAEDGNIKKKAREENS
ncbi:hypothetical protein DXG03_007737 [Asterophora parasitica]|uniref:HD/PDEase domain-containing protein n=1 Tax=Asterophora parasitica TaxID=117018 RepID=A0A9P7GC72_9AGAR|nr:hypothetical protein DXG03_007737 [Asterophora parasitica]